MWLNLADIERSCENDKRILFSDFVIVIIFYSEYQLD